MTTTMIYNELRVFCTAILLLFATQSIAQEPTQAVQELKDYSDVAGTFHFVSPTENMHFWPVSFIEELYPQIEDLRQEYGDYIWEYSNDMIIVIYSKETISRTDFVPNDSPYGGPNKL